MVKAAWRDDPDLAGRFHSRYPDDLQVIVHVGEPRRSGCALEACWVRVIQGIAKYRFPILPAGGRAPFDPSTLRWIERTVYRGTLLNQPQPRMGIQKGEDLLFLHAAGLPHPLLVRRAYLEERVQWALIPCDACGADQCLDPPTVMARTRFPNSPVGAEPIAFSAFCPCGGTMMLVKMAGEASVEGKGKAWWKIW